VPRVVDHEERRAAIVRATWELIAEKGIDETSMRDIARVAGYANAGTLSHYFTNKNDLLQRAYEYVYEATNDRIAAACADEVGIEAIRLMSREIAPVNQVTVREASIALSFWQRAIHDGGLARTSRAAIADWRVSLSRHFDVARERGEIAGGLRSDIAVDQLLAILFGMHVTGLLDSIEITTERQIVLLDSFLATLSPSWSASGTGVGAPAEHERSDSVADGA
jgi:AcrR family transcriptional regulator